MKFIADHSITKRAVEAWASPKTPILASHYFWNPGTEMQKALPGLLRSLLSEIFYQCPSMMPICCPQRWETGDKALEFPPSWTTAELLAALKTVGSQQEVPARFCFFIDGLDEYDGDHMDLCNTISHLARSPHIKVCVSSRPWNVFQDSFGARASGKFTIHELTYGDIRAYAADRLQSHNRWDASYAETGIIEQVVQRAQGVFLWVFLVTKSLRDGLTNDDSAYDLKRRLESLPTDLERLFRAMLDGVNPIYHFKMAEMMLIALQAHEPLRLEIYYHNDRCHEQEDYVFAVPTRPLPMKELRRAREQTRRQINARSQGLLELSGDLYNYRGFMVVGFLHRTARDFLQTREMSDYLSLKLRPSPTPVFSPDFAIFRAYTARIKTTLYDLGFETDPDETSGQCSGPQIREHVTEALDYCRQAYLEAPEQVFSVFCELEKSVEKIERWRSFPDNELTQILGVHHVAMETHDVSLLATFGHRESDNYQNDSKSDLDEPVVSYYSGDDSDSNATFLTELDVDMRIVSDDET